MPQNSIELLQKLMEKYSRVFMSFAGKQGVPYDDVEDIVMASFWSCYKGGYLEKMTEPEIKKVLVRIVSTIFFSSAIAFPPFRFIQ